VIRKAMCFKIAFQDFGLARIKAKVDVNRYQFIMDRNSFFSFVEEVEKGEAILSA
jgi:hypothetical protein